MTVESVSYTFSSGSPPDIDVTEALTAGEVVTIGASWGGASGGVPGLRRDPRWIEPPSLDTGQGLDSALGGQDVHALRSNGAEILPMVVSSGSMMILAETSDASRGTTDETNWVSHPSGIGYRRAGYLASSSGSGSGSGSSGSYTPIPGVSPEFDSGMNTGTTGQELERVTNFYTGAEENPTSAQSAPTPRGEQQTSGVGLPVVRPAAARRWTASWIRATATNPPGGPASIRIRAMDFTIRSRAGVGRRSGLSEGAVRSGSRMPREPAGSTGRPGDGRPQHVRGGRAARHHEHGDGPLQQRRWRSRATVALLGQVPARRRDDEPGDGSQVPEPYTPAFPGGKMPKTDMNGNAIMGDPPTDAAPGSQIVPDTPPGEGDTGQGSWDEPGGDAIIGADDPGDTSWDAGNGDGGYSLASDIFTRAMGGLQAVGGLGAAMAGGALIIAPEPVLTKVGGGVLAAVGVDNYLAGMNTLLYGKPQRTVTAAAVSGLAQKAGMDGESANNLGEGTNNAIMILGPAKAGIILKEAAAAGLGAKAANAPSGNPAGSYRPSTPLPRGPNGELIPSSPYPHTQLGTEIGRKVGPYTAAREFGPNGQPIRDIHFTDHGRPNIPGHTIPHQHRHIQMPTGGTPQFGPAEPFTW